MVAVVPWVFLWVLGVLSASHGALPPRGARCSPPPVCSLTGNWSGEAGGVQVRVWREGGRLEVEHWSRGLKLNGSTRLPPGAPAALASVLVGSRTTPGLCLQLVLSCLRQTLWVTELPLVGSFPAVAYPLQRHVTPSPTGLVQNAPRAESIAHNLLVNITLYNNLTTEDVFHDPYDEGAFQDAVEEEREEKDCLEDDHVEESTGKEGHLENGPVEDVLHEALQQQPESETSSEDDKSCEDASSSSSTD